MLVSNHCSAKRTVIMNHLIPVRFQCHLFTSNLD